jgi:hypothetical protein
MEQGSPKNITISDRANEVCDALRKLGYFSDSIEVYRAALCLAISLNLEVDSTVRMNNNKWDTAAVFRTEGKNLETMMLLLGFTPEEVVPKGKLLAEAGLKYLDEKRLANVDLLEVLVGVK